MIDRKSELEVSVIIPVGERHGDALELHAQYKAGTRDPWRIATSSSTCWTARTANRSRPACAGCTTRGERFTVVGLTRTFGEATALMAGFEHSTGRIIVTLPAYHQIVGAEIGKLVAALTDCDVAVGRRWPRAGGVFGRTAPRRSSTACSAGSPGVRLRDLGCGARAFTRRVLEEIQLYGDQHRFLAVLADRQGFVVREVDLAAVARGPLRGHLRAARLRAWPARHLHGLLPGALHEEAAALLRHVRRHDLRGRVGCS